MQFTCNYALTSVFCAADMRKLFCRILALAAFVFWASGLGQYAHETIVHHYIAIAHAGDSKHHPIPTPPPHHSDDDCAVCQGLAAMAVQQVAPPVMPVALEISFERPVHWQESFEVDCVDCFAPIRGPPVICSSL